MNIGPWISIKVGQAVGEKRAIQASNFDDDYGMGSGGFGSRGRGGKRGRY